MLFTLLFLTAAAKTPDSKHTPQATAHATALGFVNDLRAGQYAAAIKRFGAADTQLSAGVTTAARELTKAIGIKGEPAVIPQPKQAQSSENISAHADWKKKLGPHDLFEFLSADSAHGKTYFQFEFTPEGKMVVAVIGLDKSAENDAVLKRAEANATAALDKEAAASQPAPAPAKK